MKNWQIAEHVAQEMEADLNANPAVEAAMYVSRHGGSLTFMLGAFTYFMPGVKEFFGCDAFEDRDHAILALYLFAEATK